MRWFDSTNFLRLDCYKVRFKLSKINSNYFKTTVVEIETLKDCTKDRVFYRRLFASLAKICEAVGLSEYRTRMLAGQRAVHNLKDDDELEMLDGINVDFGDVG